MKTNQKAFIFIIFAIVTSIFLFLSYTNDLFSIDFIKHQNTVIKNFLLTYPVISKILALLLVIIVVIFLGPVTPICILAGFYFGTFHAFFIIVLGETIGAIVVFLYSRYFLKNFFSKMFGNRFKKLKIYFNKNSFSYLIFLRVIGGVPFAAQNILPAIFDMKFNAYCLATLIGLMPWAFILISIGNGMEELTRVDNFTIDKLLNIDYVLPIFLVILISIYPVINKYFIKKS